MKSKELILSIDNGTQSVKAMLFDLTGHMVAMEKVIFDEPYFSLHPGWAEQRPEYFWDSLCRACQGLLQKNTEKIDRIAGVALTTQRGTVINLDDNGTPLRPAIVWPDQRRAYGIPTVGGLWGQLFRVARLSDTVAYFQSEAEANWIRMNEPDIWQQTDKYLLLSGYLTHRLIGEFKDSTACQVGYLPFDYKRLNWASKWDWKWKAVAVKRAMCPDLVFPGQVMGHITDRAARESGLPVGLPLIAAASDKACEVIGSGSLDPAVGCLSYGTTATINVTHSKYVEAVPLLPAYPSVVPGYHSIEVQIYRGFWMISWFKEEFGHLEVREAEKASIEAEMLFDRLVEDVPPGSMGLMLQPYWSPGVRMPGPEAKGAIIGFGDVHTRAHIYSSILEGLAYALREGKERIEKRTKVPITRLRVSGGGSQSKKAMQVTADVFGLPTERPHLYETSGLGAAMTAAVGLGLCGDFEEAVQTMTRTGDVFVPVPKTHKLYDDLYKKVYKKMYKSLRPLYENIRKITGYPAS
ncbi:MAG: carbohydrate kinase [Proteobacteria bacterium]|nr:carbohydrate kinase [Pseudomonadota bacterium]